MLNTSGIIPTGYHVLVKPEEVEEKTKSGIYLPDQHIDRRFQAQQRGVLVAVGGTAFTRSDIWREGELSVGDNVYFDKFAGAEVKGADELKYRLLSDTDVAAKITIEG